MKSILINQMMQYFEKKKKMKKIKNMLDMMDERAKLPKELQDVILFTVPR